LYAITLLLNKRSGEAARLLTHLSIIPFEGATAGHELYREAMLMQALQSMKKKDFKRSLAFVGKAELWPENLGSGKPYDPDIDSRLEDWMKYLCFRKMGKADSAVASLRNIEAAGARFRKGQDHEALPAAGSAEAMIDGWAEQALLGKEYADKAVKAAAVSESVDRFRPATGNTAANVSNRVLSQLIPVQAKL